MKLVTYLSELYRIYIKKELIISYRQITNPKITQSGYHDLDNTLKRYANNSYRLDFNTLVSEPPVVDLLHFIRGRMNIEKSDEVLDVGCGFGAYSLLFSRNSQFFPPMKYSGCEQTNKLVELCRNLHPNVRFFRSQAQHIKSSSSSYKIVLCSGTLHYLLRGWQKSIKEFYRVSNKYVLITRVPVSKYNKNFYVEQIVKSSVGTEKHHFIVFNRADLEQEFAKNKLKVIDSDYTSEEYLIENMREKIILNNYLLEKL